MTQQDSPTSTAPVQTITDGDLDLPLNIPEQGVTEIVVHGVGGATPPGMLAEASVRQVTGDQVAGMWRGADRDAGHEGDQRWHREAYSWGGLTSGTAVSALWLLLTPFALFNVAGWMALGRRQEPGRRPDWRVPYQQALVRVLGLFATLSYVLFAAQISMDFGTWQCVQVPSCRLRDWPRGVSAVLVGHPARSVVVAALVPLAGIAALYWLSQKTTRLYEDYQPRGSAATTGRYADASDRVDPATTSLADRRIWSGAAYASRTRTVHLASSILLVATLLLAVARTGGRWTGAVNGLLIATGTLISIGVACAAWQGARRFLYHRAGKIATWSITLGLLVMAGAVAWVQPIGADGGHLRNVMPGMLEAFNAMVIAVLIFGTMHGVVALSGRIAGRRGGWPNLPLVPAPFIVVSVGSCLLFAVLVSVAVWTARWLSPSAKPQLSRAQAGDILYPVGYQVLAQFSVVIIVAIALVMVIAVAVRWFVYPPSLASEQAVWQRYGPADWIPAGKAWHARVRVAKAAADVAFGIELALALLAILSAAGGAAYALWFAKVWVGWSGTLRIVIAVTALAAGVSVWAWLNLRTQPVEQPPDQPALRRSPGEWAQVTLGFVMFAVSLAAAAAAGAPLVKHFDERPVAPLLAFSWLPGTGLSSAILAAIPIGAILLVRRAYSDQNTRRTVGTAWDVATFWPRAFHPLAPPSYAERAVPELTIRIEHLLGGGHAVLLLGHSQGAVLSAAALAQLDQLDPEQRKRLSVITYGNPVAHLYMRWFPRYFNPEFVTAIRGTAGSEVPLVNFYRRTDPVGRELHRRHHEGAPVPEQRVGATQETDDRWLVDPPIDRRRIGYGEPQVRGHAHGGYVRQEPFSKYIVSEVKRLNDLAA
jgi:hypothetical protein